MSTPTNTDPQAVPQIVSDLRSYFNTGVTRPIEWRINQLKGLYKVLDEHENEWVEALNADLGVPRFESILKIGSIKSEVKAAISHLPGWMKPDTVPNPWSLYPGGTKVVPEPYGVVCNFIPYNYPMFLGISTLVPCVAAGNVVLFKPSSNTPACAALYQTLFEQHLDQQAVKVVCGPTSICNNILECKFDYIFYTGSPSVAKIVMKAAAQHLTPVLLELGGKSPVYVDSKLHMQKACNRLVNGKFFNAGQTCVAPDYCLVNQEIFDEFCETLVATTRRFFGDSSQISPDLTHIINQRQFDRLMNVIETSNGEVLLSGVSDRDQKYVSPTIIKNPSLESPIMQEEIFGPILPLIPVESPERAIEFINSREKPLALYIFSGDANIEKMFTERTSSGAILVNDTVFHVASHECPFGGVGNSGMGQYHGITGFRALSHMKPVLTHSTFIEIESRYPPYTEDKLNFTKKFV